MGKHGIDFTSLYVEVPLAPLPKIAALYNMVVSLSEKRSPIWRFRLAPDLVISMQAKLSRQPIKFECRGVQCDGATVDMLRKRENVRSPFCSMRYEIIAGADGAWCFRARGCRWSASTNPQNVFGLLDRLTAAYADGTFDRLPSSLMSHPQCLACGRALTDPTSRARWIGPECFGTASQYVPWVAKLGAAEPADAD